MKSFFVLQPGRLKLYFTSYFNPQHFQPSKSLQYAEQFFTQYEPCTRIWPWIVKFKSVKPESL